MSNQGTRATRQSRSIDSNPVDSVYRVVKELYGDTAILDYTAQETNSRSTPTRWAVLSRILPSDPAQYAVNIGLGYGPTPTEARTEAAKEAYAYFLRNYHKELQDEGLI